MNCTPIGPKTSGATAYPSHIPKIKDNVLYFAADDRYCYAITRDGDMIDPYLMLDKPSSNWGLTNNSFYVGSMDNNLYCLDRLTMKKKWSFANGSEPIGNILAEESMVFYATKNGQVQGLRVNQGKVATKTAPETLESATKLWSTDGAGIIAAGRNVVYIAEGMDSKSGLYKGVKALDRETGKVRWRTSGGFLSLFLQAHNEAQPRIYAITSDNRIISLREPASASWSTAAAVEDPYSTAKYEKKKEGDAAAPAAPAKPEEKAPEAK